MNEPSAVFEIIHSIVNDKDDEHLSVIEMCQIAGVSRSGYYAWIKAAPIRAMQEEQDRKDFELILDAYNHRGYDKGARGIYMRLLHMDPPVRMNLKKIRRLMKKFRLICPIRKANPYRKMAQALKTSNVAENLLMREFECYGPRTVLLTDITYIPYNGRFAYLSTILDAYTKQVLAYVPSDYNLEVDFVLETVEILIRDYGISLNQWTIIHSDQGSHYTSHRFIEIMNDKELRRSMSRKGNCWDNAPQESFYGRMKDHIKGKIKDCKTFEEVVNVIDDYMDYYNNEKYQWELAKLSPNEFYKFCQTGEYPLKIDNPPDVPVPKKHPSELGKKLTQTRDKGSDNTAATPEETSNATD